MKQCIFALIYYLIVVSFFSVECNPIGCDFGHFSGVSGKRHADHHEVEHEIVIFFTILEVPAVFSLTHSSNLFVKHISIQCQ